MCKNTRQYSVVKKNISKIDLLWGYLSQFLNIGSGMLLLPFLLHYLSTEELGLWYVFMALAGLAQLLEFGFQPTIARQAAYVYAGATQIKATGLPEKSHDCVNLKLLSDLIAASKKIYGYIAFGATVVLFIAGSIYVSSLQKENLLVNNTIAPWLIYSAGSVITFYYGYYNGLLQGRGEQTAANIIIVVSKLLNVMLSILLLYLGVGLMALALANLGSAIVNRFLCNKIFYDFSKAESVYIKKNKGNANVLTLILWRSAWRLGFVQFGAFLILRANLFLATSFLGLAVAASYGLTLQLLSLLSGVSAMLMTLQIPKMNAVQSNGGGEELKELYCSSVIAAWIVYCVGALSLIFIGIPLLNILKSNTHLLPMPLLVLLIIIIFLELNHALGATYLTTLNSVPFLNASIYSGLGIFIGGMIIVYFTDYGVAGLIAVQGFVQLSYNNWKWSLAPLKQMDLKYSKILFYGISGVKKMIGH